MVWNKHLPGKDLGKNPILSKIEALKISWTLLARILFYLIKLLYTDNLHHAIIPNPKRRIIRWFHSKRGVAQRAWNANCYAL